MTVQESSCSINVYPKNTDHVVPIEALKISSFGKLLKLSPKSEFEYEFQETEIEMDSFQKQLRIAPIYYTSFLDDVLLKKFFLILMF